MNILGINAFHGDASAALVKDGRLVAAIEEERLNRRKHCAGFPALAIRAVLESGGVKPGEIDHVAISRDPKANLHKKILFTLQKRPSFTKLVKNRLANVAKVRGVEDALAAALGAQRGDLRAKLHNVEHHKSHVSSAFFVSGFDEAACLSIDGFGDFVSTMRAVGRDRDLDVLDRIEFPHSAGLFYTAITQFLGFLKYGEEWKMMGLAPYGKPTYVDKLERLIHPVSGGRFEMDLQYFRHHSEGVEMTWDDGVPELGKVYSDRLVELLGPARDPDDPEFFGKWADIAHSAQIVYERIFFHVLADLARAHQDDPPGDGGRVRAQLGGQRQDLREDAVQGGLHPAGGRRRRHQHRRRVLRRARRAARRAAVRDGARLYWPQLFRRARSSRRSSARAAPAGIPASTSSASRTPSSTTTSPRRSPTGAWSAGSRAAWSSARARSAIARSSPTLAAPT